MDDLILYSTLAAQGILYISKPYLGRAIVRSWFENTIERGQREREGLDDLLSDLKISMYLPTPLDVMVGFACMRKHILASKEN